MPHEQIIHSEVCEMFVSRHEALNIHIHMHAWYVVYIYIIHSTRMSVETRAVVCHSNRFKEDRSNCLKIHTYFFGTPSRRLQGHVYKQLLDKSNCYLVTSQTFHHPVPLKVGARKMCQHGT